MPCAGMPWAWADMAFAIVSMDAEPNNIANFALSVFSRDATKFMDSPPPVGQCASPASGTDSTYMRTNLLELLASLNGAAGAARHCHRLERISNTQQTTRRHWAW